MNDPGLPESRSAGTGWSGAPPGRARGVAGPGGGAPAGRGGARTRPPAPAPAALPRCPGRPGRPGARPGQPGPEPLLAGLYLWFGTPGRPPLAFPGGRAAVAAGRPARLAWGRGDFGTYGPAGAWAEVKALELVIARRRGRDRGGRRWSWGAARPGSSSPPRPPSHPGRAGRPAAGRCPPRRPRRPAAPAAPPPPAGPPRTGGAARALLPRRHGRRVAGRPGAGRGGGVPLDWEADPRKPWNGVIACTAITTCAPWPRPGPPAGAPPAWPPCAGSWPPGSYATRRRWGATAGPARPGRPSRWPGGCWPGGGSGAWPGRTWDPACGTSCAGRSGSRPATFATTGAPPPTGRSSRRRPWRPPAAPGRSSPNPGGGAGWACAGWRKRRRRQFAADGSHGERSPLYQALCLQALLTARTARRAGGGAWPRPAEAALRRGLDHLAGLARPDFSWPALNDSGGALGDHTALLAWAGRELGRPGLTWLGSRGQAGTPPRLGPRHYPQAGLVVLAGKDSAPGCSCGWPARGRPMPTGRALPGGPRRGTPGGGPRHRRLRPRSPHRPLPPGPRPQPASFGRPGRPSRSGRHPPGAPAGLLPGPGPGGDPGGRPAGAAGDPGGGRLCPGVGPGLGSGGARGAAPAGGGLAALPRPLARPGGAGRLVLRGRLPTPAGPRLPRRGP